MLREIVARSSTYPISSPFPKRADQTTFSYFNSPLNLVDLKRTKGPRLIDATSTQKIRQASRTTSVLGGEHF